MVGVRLKNADIMGRKEGKSESEKAVTRKAVTKEDVTR